MYVHYGQGQQNVRRKRIKNEVWSMEIQVIQDERGYEIDAQEINKHSFIVYRAGDRLFMYVCMYVRSCVRYMVLLSVGPTVTNRAWHIGKRARSLMSLRTSETWVSEAPLLPLSLSLSLSLSLILTLSLSLFLCVLLKPLSFSTLKRQLGINICT